MNDELQKVIDEMSLNIKCAYQEIIDASGTVPTYENLENLPQYIRSLSGNMPQFEMTYYTQADIDNSDGHLIAVGKNNPLYVVAEISQDETSVIITRNGDDSDGIIQDYVYNSRKEPHSTTPLYLCNAQTYYFKEGIYEIGSYFLYRRNNSSGSYIFKYIDIILPQSLNRIKQRAFNFVQSVQIPRNTRVIDNFAGVAINTLTYEDQSKIIHSNSAYSFQVSTKGTLIIPDCAQGHWHIDRLQSPNGLYVGDGVTKLSGGGYFGIDGEYTQEYSTFHLSDNIIQIANPLENPYLNLQAVLDSQIFNHASKIRVKKLILPKKLQYIGYNHFFYDFATSTLDEVYIDPQNQYFCTVDGVLYTKDMTRLCLYPPMKADKKFVIPNTVTQMNFLGFSRNKLIEEIQLSDNFIVEKLPLPSINENVTFLMNSLSYCFYNFLLSLTSVTVSENNQRYKSVDGLLYTVDNKKFLYAGPGVTEIHILDGVQEILVGSVGALSNSSQWFNAKNNYTRIKIYVPSSVTTIAQEYWDKVSDGSDPDDVRPYIDVYVDENNLYWTTEEVTDSHGTYHRLKRK